jgi:uncharacterized protein
MNLSDELFKLQELYTSGALSDEEFSNAKASLIKSSSAIVEAPIVNEQVPPQSSSPQSSSPQPGQSKNLEPNQWAMFLHLSLLTSLIVPVSGLIISILIWQLKKEEIPQIEVHGRNMANWELSLLIYGIISVILTPFLIGFPLLAALIGCKIVFPIIAGLNANEGKAWQYPLAIRFLR